MKKTLSALLAAVILLSLLSLSAAAEDTKTTGADMEITVETTAIPESEETVLHTTVAEIDKYGNLDLAALPADYASIGLQAGDVVIVTIGQKQITLPVGTAVSDVNVQENILVISADKNKSSMYCNMSSFAERQGIAVKQTGTDTTVWLLQDGLEDPIPVEIALLEKGGYQEQWELHQLTRTNSRDDYPDLTDAEYANFRCVSAAGLGENILYRSTSPISAKLKRNTYADAACRETGIRTVLNLTDTQAEAEGLMNGTYYGTCDVIYCPITQDLQNPENLALLADGLRALANAEPPYLVHCVEGKDRTGIVCALLECLAGATPDEVKADYLVTYRNFYGVEPGSEKADALLNANLLKSLKLLFGVDSPEDCDLRTEAADFLVEIGLTSEEVCRLQTRLAGN